MISTIIICLTVFLLGMFTLAVFAGRMAKTQTPCYFAQSFVQINGKSIGEHECSGAADNIYLALDGSPSAMLRDRQTCGLHRPSLLELADELAAADLAEDPTGFWRVSKVRSTVTK